MFLNVIDQHNDGFKYFFRFLDFMPESRQVQIIFLKF